MRPFPEAYTRPTYLQELHDLILQCYLAPLYHFERLRVVGNPSVDIGCKSQTVECLSSVD